LTQHYIGDAPGSPTDTLALPTQKVLGLLADACIESATNGVARVWYIVFDRQVPNDLPWLDAHYRRVDVTAINDLKIYQFDQSHSKPLSTTCVP
jgi:hypothetical protein